LRGIEAMHKSFVDDRMITDAVEEALALLPRRNERRICNC
jgi:hypothetical protein